MDVDLQNLGKRFNREQIFSGLNYKLKSSNFYAIIGPNGSGKSTLLQIIAGNQLASAGKVVYQNNNATIPAEDFYQHISFASPYLELVEEFTLLEQLTFHFKYKPLKKGETLESVLSKAYLTEHRNKVIKHFSSGMKQRLKLALVFFAETPVLLMDEPTSNLDEKGIHWYLEQCKQLQDQLVVIASNQKREYDFCDEQININDFK